MSKLSDFFRSKTFDVLCFVVMVVLMVIPVIMFQLGIGFTNPLK